jgi:hypothetical protein
MGIISRLVETFSLGCRSRTLSLEEDKNCYDGHRCSVIPVSQEVGEEDTNCYDGHRCSVIPVSGEVGEEDKNCYDGRSCSVIPVSGEVGEEDTNCYDGHRRSVIPVSRGVIMAVNEVGEEVIIEIVSKPK